MERRNEILTYIRNRPGVTFRELARALGVGIGDLQYHLRKLEREGKVFSRKVGRRRYIFPAGFEDEAQRLLMAISTETRRKILLLLMEGPKSQGEIAGKLRVSQPTVSYHMRELEKLGVVKAERTGKSVVYTINYDPETVVRLIKDYRPGLWEKLADSLIDLLAGMGEGE